MMKDSINTNSSITGLSLTTAKTGVKDVVSLRASFLAGTRFGATRSIASVTSQMLMLGTNKRTKDQITQILEGAAISLEIGVDETRVNIKASAPRERLDLLVSMLAEILSQPTFDEGELVLLKERIKANLKQQKTETSSLAWKQLLRTSYSKEHPFYTPDEDTEIKELETLNNQDLKNFHAKHYGLGSVKMVVAGDVDHDEMVRLVSRHFGNWRQLSTRLVPELATVLLGQTESIYVPDKASNDVFLGGPIDLPVHSRDYFAFKIAIHILGGDFVSRLMREIREKRGLTYGTNSLIFGLKDGDTGIFAIWGTFAPTLLGEGISEMRKVLSSWAERGVTPTELSRAKMALAGNWKVSLSNSGGVAKALLSLMELGWGLSLIDEYPEVIENISLAEVNASIRKYVNTKYYSLAVAGSLEKSAKALG